MTKEHGLILVVDDNEMNRDVLARRLERHGYTVSGAENGQQALNMLVEQKFDLVLLDIMMPIMDGIAVLKLIRKTYPIAELPVIMVTAKGETGDVVNALELGANDYITKPLNFAVVLARVRTHFALKRSNDEISSLARQLEARNDFIRNIFGRYVANEVVDKLLESEETLKFGGELRKITIMFADLMDFTSISEKLAPKQVVTMLNNYLGTMIEIIASYRGIVDELAGDGILAFFGAPIVYEEHAQKATACAVEMQAAMESVNEKNRAQGIPEVQMGIGINTGEVVVGNIGSEKRSKYSAVGNHINLSSRIKSYSVGGQILISEATLADTGAVVRIDGQKKMHPKGLEHPITVYEISGIGGKYNLFLPKD